MKPYNPHDIFFKEAFTRSEGAAGLLQNALPANILGQLDLTTLEIRKDSFVDARLKEHRSDLLYQTRCAGGENAFIYVLFEHKSYVERWICLDLLRYMVQIWDQERKQGGQQPLSPIIPLVFYHGQDAWTPALNLKSIFACPEWFLAYLPDFQYVLYDLSQHSDEEIRGEALLRVFLLLFKHISSHEFPAKISGIINLLGIALDESQSGLEVLRSVLQYIVSGSDQIREAELKEIIHNAFIGKGEEVMQTIAETWLQKGKKQGIQQGVQQGIKQGVIMDAQEMVIEALVARFETVPKPMVKKIKGITLHATLKGLLRSAVKTVDLAEFEEVLRKVEVPGK